MSGFRCWAEADGGRNVAVARINSCVIVRVIAIFQFLAVGTMPILIASSGRGLRCSSAAEDGLGLLIGDGRRHKHNESG
jgi:hypothetical protein